MNSVTGIRCNHIQRIRSSDKDCQERGLGKLWRAFSHASDESVLNRLRVDTYAQFPTDSDQGLTKVGQK